MGNEIEITTQLCQSQIGLGCNNVILKIPQNEAMKLQSVAFSSNGNQSFSTKDFIHHVDSFGFSFGLVLIFYLIAKSVGAVLAIFK
ncbi:hypothetical protein [Haemophilus haemolyticus]|jgi:hypothetical protein|uniref:hypothetical protein n=2 Tax=Haemophilus haemolyticus TaxID=726 RepID=UPI000E57DA25|nr:hypothetical protein [Haemophilus haemolyticus]DAQ50393.1 MAG TPA: Inovirus G7P protein [Inoviridae sp.]